MYVSVRWLYERSMRESIEINDFNYTLTMRMNPVNPSVAGMKSKADWNHHKGERVTNNNMVDSCKLRPGEDYSTVFRHKVEDRPTLSMGCHVCHKFHNKDFCNKDCENAASNCKLTNNYFIFMDKRIKVLHAQ